MVKALRQIEVKLCGREGGQVSAGLAG